MTKKLLWSNSRPFLWHRNRCNFSITSVGKLVTPEEACLWLGGTLGFQQLSSKRWSVSLYVCAPGRWAVLLGKVSGSSHWLQLFCSVCPVPPQHLCLNHWWHLEVKGKPWCHSSGMARCSLPLLPFSTSAGTISKGVCGPHVCRLLNSHVCRLLK